MPTAGSVQAIIELDLVPSRRHFGPCVICHSGPDAVICRLDRTLIRRTGSLDLLRTRRGSRAPCSPFPLAGREQ